MKKILLFSVGVLLLLCTESCRKCYVCKVKRVNTGGTINYRSRERVHFCPDTWRSNDESDAIMRAYENDGYNCYSVAL